MADDSSARDSARGGRHQVDAATIERLRQSGIRIDREGELIHEGEVIRHEGLRAALFRWLDRLDDPATGAAATGAAGGPAPSSRFVLRLDAGRFAYVDVDDTPLVVRAAAWRGDDMTLALSDGAEETLRPETLTLDAEGVLRCLVRGGRLPARLSTSAAAVLGERVIEEAGALVLRIGARRYRLPRPPGGGGTVPPPGTGSGSAAGR